MTETLSPKELAELRPVDRIRKALAMAEAGYHTAVELNDVDVLLTAFDALASQSIEREAETKTAIAVWMTHRGYATGHGDTTEDLLGELECWVRRAAIEECVNIALAIDSGRGNEKEIAKACRALTQQPTDKTQESFPTKAE